MNNESFEKWIIFFLFGFLIVVVVFAFLGHEIDKEKIEVEKQKIDLIKKSETLNVVRV